MTEVEFEGGRQQTNEVTFMLKHKSVTAAVQATESLRKPEKQTAAATRDAMTDSAGGDAAADWSESQTTTTTTTTTTTVASIQPGRRLTHSELQLPQPSVCCSSI